MISSSPSIWKLAHEKQQNKIELHQIHHGLNISTGFYTFHVINNALAENSVIFLDVNSESKYSQAKCINFSVQE